MQAPAWNGCLLNIIITSKCNQAEYCTVILKTIDMMDNRRNRKADRRWPVASIHPCRLPDQIRVRPGNLLCLLRWKLPDIILIFLKPMYILFHELFVVKILLNNHMGHRKGKRSIRPRRDLQMNIRLLHSHCITRIHRNNLHATLFKLLYIFPMVVLEWNRLLVQSKIVFVCARSGKQIPFP